MNFSKKFASTVVAASALMVPVMTASPASASTVKSPSTVKKWDSRCMSGRTVCVDKKARTMAWIVNGKVVKTFPIRSGKPGYETRSGVHKIYWKNKNHRSTLYHVSMPYSQFFSGGQAIHYSAEFASKGYMRGSHGCVNMKSKTDAAWLFSQTRTGDKVVVY